MGTSGFSVKDLLEEENVAGLLQALQKGDNSERKASARALGELGDAQAVDGLFGALADRNMDVRTQAAKALGMIGEERAVGPLITALNDTMDYPVFRQPLRVPCSNIDARGEAALALGTIGGNDAIKALRTAPETDTSQGVYRGLSVAEAVEKALAELGMETAEAAVAPTPSDIPSQKTQGFSPRHTWRRWFGGSTQSAEEWIKSVNDLLLRGDLKKALKAARKATEIDPDNGYAWMQLGKVHTALKEVLAAIGAFRTAIEAQPSLRGSEPGARLAVVYDHLGMTKELEDVCSALREAGLGLDPRAEAEWEELVTDTDQQKLRAAVGGTPGDPPGSTKQLHEKAGARIHKMLAKAGPTTLSGCTQILAVAILHEQPSPPGHSPQKIAGLFVEQYKGPGWVPPTLSVGHDTPVEMVHRRDAAGLQVSDSNAIIADTISGLVPGVYLDECSAITFSGDNPAMGKTFFSLLAR